MKQKKSLRRIGIFVLATLLWALPMTALFRESLLTASAASADTDSGHFFDSAEQIAALPKFDPRDALTPVKDQGTTNLCWAYAAVHASEASILKHRLGTKDTLRLNPQALAFRKYVRAADPLGNNADYRSEAAGNWQSAAGQIEHTAALLSMWQGPIAGNTPQADVAENALYRLESANLILSGLTGDERIAEIKRAIAEYGAVTATCYYDGGTKPYYNDKAVSNGIAHAITLIGWDDNIDKSLFRPGNVTQNGGWLVKNSYNDNGYFYLTYESNISSSTAWTFSYAAKDAYDYNYYYDNSESDLGLYRLKQAANVYEAKKGSATKAEYIEAVNVGFSGNDVSVTIKVYINLKDQTESSVESGILAAEKTQTFRYGGYQTVRLDTPVKVAAGTYFSVVAEVADASGSASMRTIQSEVKKPSFQKASYGYDFIAYGGRIARIKAYTKLRDETPESTVHRYGDLITEVAPTCSSYGMRAHYLCSECASYFDEEKNETTAEALKIAIDPNAHAFGAWVDEISADCVTSGTKGHKDCTLCHKHFGSDGGEIADLTIPADENHDFGDWISNGDGTHTRLCKRNAAHRESGHCIGGTATCTEKARCEVCGAAYGETTSHNTIKYGGKDQSGHFDTCSTCKEIFNFEAHTPDRETADETHPVRCTECGFIITPAGHYIHTPGDEWHLSADGKYHYRLCTYANCAEILNKEAHSGGTATCTEKARCEVCGAAYGDALGHLFGEAVYTWSDDGVCKAERVCGRDKTHTESESVTAAKTVLLPASCTAKGKIRYTTPAFENAAFSIQEREEDLAPLPHAYGTQIEEVPATCTAPGCMAHYHCASCGQYFDGNKVKTPRDALTIPRDPKAHVFGTWVDEVPPTATATGTKGHKDCVNCGRHFDKNGGEIADLTIEKIEPPKILVSGGTLQSEDESYREGDTVTVIANAPEEGKIFRHWQNADGEIVSTQKEYTFVVTGDLSLTAIYEPLPSGDTSGGAGSDSDNGSGENPDDGTGGATEEKPAPAPAPDDGKAGLSERAILGIVIGAILFFGVGGFLLYRFFEKERYW